ncbi:MAG: ATP-binding cassette domain-containing protein [Rhodospirillaceae bacterium]|nr:ATP-binding cassette domain-containing protein [Rhodospirillaceae bacterium]MYH36103.1 ATP-binding cassette domain-containing protein [Rhodospirillaceae bacterium]MYK12713.1 ATP-binding cassette domain-containing protein [Rhodospirillaceae bacterium]MYK59912.1 ATP-binding cassette domain-containing protein [Rhodospirillaceae bacterium]
MTRKAKNAARPEPAVTVRGLENRFGANLLHDGLDLDVLPGEVLGVVGSSGSGKTVLMRSIIGLNRPRAGEVSVLGENLSALQGRQRKALLARIGVLFQNGALFSGLTVAENIALVLKLHTGLAPGPIDRLARQKIDMAGLPQDTAGKMPAQLSGGMRTRAGLARALALDPEIVFLDEPTAGLDPIGAADFDRLIRELQQSLGLTVFMVTHDLNSLVAIADRIAVLVDRKIRVGPLDELLNDPHPWIQAYFRGPRARAAHDAAGSGH